ncbi:MAG: hypothetical protein FJ110_04575 [Deltaproteobacteria bacterium]|nr:hypothetical protein [Deltaproteobacteria bacterium]
MNQAQIEKSIRYLKRLWSVEGISLSVKRHSYAMSPAERRKWKQNIARERLKQAQKRRQFFYEQRGKELKKQRQR